MEIKEKPREFVEEDNKQKYINQLKKEKVILQTWLSELKNKIKNLENATK